MAGTTTQRRALGEFVRAHRARLTPAALGLPAGARRRTPGLRREEVAQLCGMSATWYTWIEQGRDVAASPAALGRLAQVLQLSPAERAYLFELAGRRDPTRPAPAAMDAPPALVASLVAIAQPAYVLDRTVTARAWNDAAARLFIGWLDGKHDRNLLRYIFTSKAARRLIVDWEERARRVVAEFRADTTLHLDDPAIRALIDDLRAKAPAFKRMWDEQAVVDRAGGVRRFAHQDGLQHYEQLTFTLASRPEFKLVMLVPAQAPR
jgi:transcriptional regulator with XRE-family HTH domain